MDLSSTIMEPRSVRGFEPILGTLPVEQYVLNQWDRASTLSIEEQRYQLVQDFVQEDDNNTIVVTTFAWHESETKDLRDLYDMIIEPWRPRKLRNIAKYYLEDSLDRGVVLLRTYYDGGTDDDEKIKKWIKDLDPQGSLLPSTSSWRWRLLNDAKLFNTSSDGWQSIYTTFPELARSHSHPHRVLDEFFVHDVKEALRYNKDPTKNDFEMAIMDRARREGIILLVADQKAFESDELSIFFLDKKGAIIKTMAMKPSQIEIFLLWDRFIAKTITWRDGVVGDDYKPGGNVMKALMPLVSNGRFTGDAEILHVQE